MYLRQNSAVKVQLGPAIATGGVNYVSGLTAGNVTGLRLIKHGATVVVTATGRSFGHVFKGDYVLSLATTGTADTNTLGHLRVYVTATGAVKALPFWRDFVVVPANVYDSLVSGSSKLNVGTLTSGANVWAAATRTLTSGGVAWTAASRLLTSGAAVWAAGTKVLTSGGVVWTAGTRTLTSAGVTWTAGTRTLTSGSVVWSVGVRKLSASGNTDVAQRVWAIPMATIAGAASRSPLNAIRYLRNRWSATGSTLRVYTEDDVTQAWQSALTLNSGASPVIDSNPA